MSLRRAAITTTACCLALLASGMTGTAVADGKFCRIVGSAEGLADLKAKRVSCASARAVYRASLRAAMKDPDAGPTRFRRGGRTWACRASNPQREINGQYVHYVWRCTARGGRVVRYRWLAGE